MVNTTESKIKRMSEHKEELARRYWLMKKESKAARSRESEQLILLVDVSQTVIEVGYLRTCLPTNSPIIII